MELKFAEVLKEARKVVPEGAVDVKVDFIGEFTPEDASEGIPGRYNAEIRFLANGNVDENYTCIRWFDVDEGEGFDPNIATSEMVDFEFYPFEIVSIERS